MRSFIRSAKSLASGKNERLSFYRRSVMRQLQNRFRIRWRKALAGCFAIRQPLVTHVLARRQRHWYIPWHQQTEYMLSIVRHAGRIAMAPEWINLVHAR